MGKTMALLDGQQPDETAWNQRYSVSVPQLDSQHRQILDLLQEMKQDALGGEAAERVPAALEKLNRYVVLHLRREERLLSAVRYPQSEEHRREHDSYLEKVAAIQTDLQRGRRDVAIRLTNFLGSWWTHHILTSDRQYGRYILQRKMSGDAGAPPSSGTGSSNLAGRFEWRDDYSFNRPEVDEQHREFLAVAKRICEPASGDGSFDLVVEVANLMQYTSFHFFTEESLMGRIGYPNLEQHIAAHRGFEAQLMDAISKIPDGTLQCKTVATLVESWARTHLLGDDMELQKFLKLLDASSTNDAG
jgi:hemerythrin